MKAVIVAHGRIDDMDFAKSVMESGDMIVCADGGAEFALKCGFTPDACVGDFDSISAAGLEMIKKKCPTVIRYPAEKDYTDTQIAVRYAADRGADEMVLLGCIGNRIDHTAANILLLACLLRANIKASLVNEKNMVCMTDSGIKVDGKPGELLSLMPIGGDALGVRTSGLKYALSGQDIVMGNPVGVSNVFVSSEAEITVESGMLLVIKSSD